MKNALLGDDAAADSDGTFLEQAKLKACKTLENALLDGQQANVGEQVIAVARGRNTAGRN